MPLAHSTVRLGDDGGRADVYSAPGLTPSARSRGGYVTLEGDTARACS